MERGSIWGRQGVRAALGERAVQVGVGGLGDERVDPGDEVAGLPNFFKCRRPGVRVIGEAEELAAAEILAAGWPPRMDRAPAIPVSGAGLEEKLRARFPLDFQAQSGEGACGVAGLKEDRVKQDPIAA